MVLARLEARAAPRLHRDIDTHLSLDHAERAQERTGGGIDARSEACPGAHEQRIGDPQRSGGGADLGHQDTGVAIVELPRLDRILGSDGEDPPATTVENATEERRRIEARHAQPGDRAVASDQRRRGAIADQPVVLDRQIAVEPSNRAKLGISRHVAFLARLAASFTLQPRGIASRGAARL